MSLSLWFRISIRAASRNGICQKQLYEAPPSTITGRLFTDMRFPNCEAKKSPTGASTSGSVLSSQNMRSSISW